MAVVIKTLGEANADSKPVPLGDVWLEQPGTFVAGTQQFRNRSWTQPDPATASVSYYRFKVGTGTLPYTSLPYGTLTDLDQIREMISAAGLDPSQFATAAQGALADSAVQPGDLAPVAFSGAYADLTGTPPPGVTVHADLTGLAADDHPQYYNQVRGDARYVRPGDLATVATTGDYNDLINTPPTGGDVVGPASATDGAFSLYDGTTGKIIKDGPLPSTGGNGAADSGKVATFDLEGQLHGSVASSSNPAIRGTSTGTGYAGYFEAVGANDAVKIQHGGSGAALKAQATGTGLGADIESKGVALSAHSAYTGVGTPDIAEFSTGLVETVKLRVKFDGGLEFPSGGTGPATTLTNLGVSAFVQTILNDPDAATVRATIGAGTGTGDALVANPLSQFAATTSAELAGVITDETGTGLLVFNDSPTFVTPALGTPSALIGTNITGTGAGFTAGTVTTNADLTGPVTSVGNATSIANDAVTQAMMTDMATGTIMGRQLAAGTGDPEHLTPAQARLVMDVPTNAEAILDTLIAAKGDIVVGTANDTPVVLTVGTDGMVLQARASTTEGLVWVAPHPILWNVYSLPGTGITYTNMTAAVSWFNNATNSRPAIFMDLTDCTEIMVVVGMNATIGAANAKICARYRSAYSVTASDYSQIGTGSTEAYAPIGTGTATSIQAGTAGTGNWTTITAAARAPVILGCFGLDGDGALDPTIGNVAIYVR